MADLKISQLTGASTPLAGTEVLPIVQSGSTVKVSVANLTAGRTQTSNGIIQGTAATGYNFSANTTAAGKTSTLLNWYEEGTWTPSIGSLSGSIASVTNISGTYTRVGRLVSINFLFTIASAGTGSGAITITDLPYPVFAAQSAVGVGREYFNSGYMMQLISDTASLLFAQRYDGAYRGSDGDQFSFSMTYST
jgi:hypothetical protein